VITRPNIFSLLFLAIVLALPAPFSAAGAQQSNSLRVATYNLENFFDRYDDPYVQDMDTNTDTQPKSFKALDALASIIKKVNPDILALQEVENRGFLEEFNAAWLKDMHYTHQILIEGNNSHADDYSRGIDVALLARVPVLSVTSYQDREFSVRNRPRRFSRDLLHARFKPFGFPELHVFVLHAPSRNGGTQAFYRRVAEAKEAAVILSELFAGSSNANIIVTGDFNDDPGSASLGVYTSIPGVPLLRLPAGDPAGRSFTWYGGKRSAFPPIAFDHILVSPAVARKIPGGSARIWNGPEAEIASDHRPVYTTLYSAPVSSAAHALKMKPAAVPTAD